MKPFQKVLAALLAIVLVVSMASCVPKTLTKEWSYKYGDATYDIGVYIYALYSAYNEAASYAKDAEGYKEDESFINLEIEDSDGKKAKAGDWIKEKADLTCRQLLAVDKLVAEKGATWDEATMTAAEDATKSAWEMGAYVSVYGSQYYSPLKDQIEKYGVSYDSFKQVYVSPVDSSIFALKTNSLFDALYAEGGSEEVSDKDLTDFFTKNYLNYSYISVKLYDEETDDDGNTTNKAYSADKIKKIKSVLEGYADSISGGSKFADVAEKAEKKYTTDKASRVEATVDTKTNIEDSLSDIYKVLKGLKNGKAGVTVVGEDGDAPVAYVVVKNDIKDSVDDYIGGAQRESVLQNMKSDDFKDFLKDSADGLAKDNKYQKNEGATGAYASDMFFEKPEPTTSAESDDSEESEE